MPMYGLPDITGLNPSYQQVNMPFFVYELGVKVSFENSPVFLNSVEIRLVDSNNTVLQRGIDWDYDTIDIDQTAMSRAFLEDADFPGILIKSLSVLSARTLRNAITIDFQEFYLTNPGRTFDDGTPLELTPDLIKNLISNVAAIRQQIANVQSPIVSNLTAPSFLPFDIHKSIPGNLISEEEISINTISGASVIRLSQGAFFADSLIISHNGIDLDPATDYLPLMLSPLTDRSLNTSAIYHYILINKPISGPILITYHALGGDVQQEDVESIYGLMVAIKDFLNNGSFLTAQGVSQTPAFSAFNARLNNLESDMRILLDGLPTYGDATGGLTTIRPIAATDANFHWWTIANLYQVAGSPSIISADQFKGRIFLPGADVALGFTIDVNLDPTVNQVSFKTDSVVFDPLYKLFESVSVAAPAYPLVRVVWNQTGTSFSGASLQIGIPLTALSDTLTIEDMSSSQSCWILDRTGAAVNTTAATVSNPRDSGFLLPDGSSLWSTSGLSSFSRTFVPKFEDGYLVYSGSTLDLGDITTTSNTASLFNSVLPYYFPVDNVKEIVVTLLSNDGVFVYDVVIPVVARVTGTKTGSAAFTASTGEKLSIKATLIRRAGTTASIALNIFNDTGTYAFQRDDIRYIRARV